MKKISEDDIYEKTILYFICSNCGGYSEVNGGEEMSESDIPHLDCVYCEHCGASFKVVGAWEEEDDELEEEEEDE